MLYPSVKCTSSTLLRARTGNIYVPLHEYPRDWAFLSASFLMLMNSHLFSSYLLVYFLRQCLTMLARLAMNSWTQVMLLSQLPAELVTVNYRCMQSSLAVASFTMNCYLFLCVLSSPYSKWKIPQSEGPRGFRFLGSFYHDLKNVINTWMNWEKWKFKTQSLWVRWIFLLFKTVFKIPFNSYLVISLEIDLPHGK
jgi:hypothetical protein